MSSAPYHGSFQFGGHSDSRQLSSKQSTEDQNIVKSSKTTTMNRSSDQRMAQSQINEQIYNQKMRINYQSDYAKSKILSSNQVHSQPTQNQTQSSNQDSIKQSSSTVLRQGSIDKIAANSSISAATAIGSTGGSQSFTLQINKKPLLKLSSQLINHTSIATPQTTQNLHSSRMISYQNPHVLNPHTPSQHSIPTTIASHYNPQHSHRGQTSSTPKTQNFINHPSTSLTQNNKVKSQMHPAGSNHTSSSTQQYSSNLTFNRQQALSNQQINNSQSKTTLEPNLQQQLVEKNQSNQSKNYSSNLSSHLKQKSEVMPPQIITSAYSTQSNSNPSILIPTTHTVKEQGIQGSQSSRAIFNEQSQVQNMRKTPSSSHSRSNAIQNQLSQRQLLQDESNSYLTQNSSSQSKNNHQTSQKAPSTIEMTNNSSLSEIVKVGMQVPKTTTGANLRNFNNLRQFNQIFNNKQATALANVQVSNKSSSQHSFKKSISSSIGAQLAQQNGEENQRGQRQEVGDSQNTQSHSQSQTSLLQNHQRHIQQQSSQINLQVNKSRQKAITQVVQDQLQSDKQKSVNQKVLQISIPSSPRNEDPLIAQQNTLDQNRQVSQQSDSQTLLQKQTAYSGSLSTTNQNQGNIKLSKFTCNSTRNQTKKANIFSQKESLKNQASEELQSNAHTQIDNQQSNQNVKRVFDINQQEEMPLQAAHKIIIPNHESTKHSVKRNGVVRAYAANTNQGLVRTYNEDRVSIILNILKPPNRKEEHWPRCSFFGIYDGHGGSACADYLRDNLHQFVIKELTFPSDPAEALRVGFANAEKKFLELCQNENGIVDKSGSCAIVTLIVEDQCFVANVGDSRAIMSSDGGQKVIALSRDHKPNDDLERKRIIEAGGQIYHRTATTNIDASDPSKKEIVVGPLRVLPGRLSVSRTFGDVEAKLLKYGGNPNVVIATPEIKQFRISQDHDFIVLGCDGIFDKLSNEDTLKCVWNSVQDNKSLGFAQNIHKQSGMAVEYILKNSLLRRTLDNVTVVMIAFNNFKHSVFGSTKQLQQKKQSSDNLQKNAMNQNCQKQESKSEQIQQARQIRKENMPPSAGQFFESQHQQHHVSQKDLAQHKKSNLGINTTASCTQQGPKTTTNAQLKRGETGITSSFQDSTLAFLSSNNTNLQLATNNSSCNRNSKQGSNGNSQKEAGQNCIAQSSQNNRAKHFDFSNV